MAVLLRRRQDGVESLARVGWLQSDAIFDRPASWHPGERGQRGHAGRRRMRVGRPRHSPVRYIQGKGRVVSVGALGWGSGPSLGLTGLRRPQLPCSGSNTGQCRLHCELGSSPQGGWVFDGAGPAPRA
eukprot:scaffold29617_cov24-Tisochrysis_lutea.AAC.2